MLRKVVRILFSPARWVLRFGLGGQTRTQKFTRRLWLVVSLLVFCVAPLTWIGLWARLNLSESANQVNLVELANATVQEILKEDRAWPLYEQALAIFEADDLILVPAKAAHRALALNAPWFEYPELTKGRSLERYTNFSNDQQLAIGLIIDGTRRPELGLELAGGLEHSLDNSKVAPQPNAFDDIHLLTTALRTELFAAVSTGDGTRAAEVIESVARLQSQLVGYEGQFAMPVCYAGRMRWWAADIGFILLEYPNAFSNADLVRLSRACEEIALRGRDPRTDRMRIENQLDQMYSSSGAFTMRGIEVVGRRVCSLYGGPNFPSVKRKHRAWLCPRVGRRSWLRELESQLVLPVAVLGFPSRDALRKQILASLKKQEATPYLSIREYTAATEKYTGPVPSWAELPHLTFSWRFPARTDPDQLYRLRLRCIVLLIELERYRRITGEWPTTLEGVDASLVPRDPYRVETPIQYALRNGRPYLWSIGADYEDQHGEPLNASHKPGTDWQLVPTPDFPFPYVKKLREQKAADAGGGNPGSE